MCTATIAVTKSIQYTVFVPYWLSVLRFIMRLARMNKSEMHQPSRPHLVLPYFFSFFQKSLLVGEERGKKGKYSTHTVEAILREPLGKSPFGRRCLPASLFLLSPPLPSVLA